MPHHQYLEQFDQSRLHEVVVVLNIKLSACRICMLAMALPWVRLSGRQPASGRIWWPAKSAAVWPCGRRIPARSVRFVRDIAVASKGSGAKIRRLLGDEIERTRIVDSDAIVAGCDQACMLEAPEDEVHPLA